MSAGTIISAAPDARPRPRTVLRLDVGEPDFATPAHIVDAAARALRDGRTRYTAPEGIAPLRGAIAEHLRSRGCAAAPEQVVVTSGAKPAICHVLRALLGDGDAALVPDPGYPGYHAAVALANGVAIPYPVTDDRGAFHLDVHAIEACITPRTRVLILNSPHNPTGGVASGHELDMLAELALRHRLHVLSDEVYSAITYEGPPAASIASRRGMVDRTAVVGSFSKTYAMTGWRLGWAHLPPSLVARVRDLVLNTATCTPEFVQAAGLAALEGPQDHVRTMVSTYRHRRDVLVRALQALPDITVESPAGAFYVFPRMTAGARRDDGTHADRLLRDGALACIDGTQYGARGAGHVRLSFAVSAGALHEAARRLARFARSLQ